MTDKRRSLGTHYLPLGHTGDRRISARSMLERLPTEIANYITARVPPWELPRLSLVCSDWQLLVSPHLYRTLFFNNYETTNKLVDRINNDHGLSGFCVVSYVYELLVDIDPREAVNGDDGVNKCSSIGLRSLSDTKHAMMQLKNLESVYWGSKWLSACSQIVREVQLYTKLRSVELSLEIVDLTQASAEQILSLENLQKICLTFFFNHHEVYSETQEESSDEETDSNQSVAGLGPPDIPFLFRQMLHASPGLEELSLSFITGTRDAISSQVWTPESILETLAVQTFPHLRALRLIYELSQLGVCPKIHRFLLNHPNIHTLDVCLGQGTRLWPQDQMIEELVPSIRHFKGSRRLAESLTQSAIADQLETLTIYESHLGRYLIAPPDLYSEPLALPLLRQLEVKENVAIQSLVDAAPNLERIKMFTDIGLYSQNTERLNTFINLIRSVPKTRFLQLFVSCPQFKDPKPTGDVARQIVHSVAELCPYIRRIEYRSFQQELLGYWDVICDHNGNSDYHYHFNPTFTLFSGVNFSANKITTGLGSPPCRWHGSWYNSLSFD